jgi:undecaprenyl-diphosphatase
MIDTLIAYDIELFLLLNNLGTAAWDAFWLFVTNKYSHIPLYLLLLFFTYRAFGFKKTLFTLLAVALLITLTDQTSNFFKYGFERLRPCHYPDLEGIFRLVKERCGGKYSFFSAHAANSMAIAVFFGLLLKSKFKYVQLLLLFWGFLLGYSRIYIGVHYPLDVLTGFLVGAVYAGFCYVLLKWIFSKIERSEG